LAFYTNLKWVMPLLRSISASDYCVHIKNYSLLCKKLDWKRFFYICKTSLCLLDLTAVVWFHRNEQK
jgi:hypothetical protein